MAHRQTEAIYAKATDFADTLRKIGALYAGHMEPHERDVLEIAALLLEQTSATRIRKAIHAFNQAHDRYVRRQKVGLV